MYTSDDGDLSEQASPTLAFEFRGEGCQTEANVSKQIIQSLNKTEMKYFGYVWSVA